MKNLLIYYGWTNSFNSAQNGWDNQKVAEDMAKYGLIVLGNGLQEPSHGDHVNTHTIIDRIHALNPAAKIFGYVTVNQFYGDFTTKVGQWADMNVDGIFFDEAGYDYGTTTTNGRAAFNSKVDYVHSRSKICFINAWKIQHVYGIENDVSYPNSTWNPDLLIPNLTSADWYLFESFGIWNDGSYEPKADWKARGDKFWSTVSPGGLNTAAVCCIPDSDVNGQAKFDFMYASASVWGLDAVGSSDLSYGSGSATTKMWNRPTPLPTTYEENWSVPTVINSSVDSDVYLRYCTMGKMKVDFSTGAQVSSITEY